MLTKERFEQYFDLEKIKNKKVIVDDPIKNKKFVYIEEIDGKKYYIKKYSPYRLNHKIWMLIGIKKDLATHYKIISEKLKRLNILHAEPIYILKNKKSLFNIESLIVMKDCGKMLPEYGVEEKLIKKFMEYFLTIIENQIYPTDYNIWGALVNEQKELILIDFDAYRLKWFVTKKFKKYVLEKYKKNFYEDYEEENSKKILNEFRKYSDSIKENIEKVKVTLKL